MKGLKIPERMVEWSLWALWWLLIGNAGLWGVVGAIGYWNRLGWMPAEVAVWVQAFGSVGALGVAIWISSRQRQEQINDLHRRERVVVRVVVEIASKAVSAMDQLDTACRAPHLPFRNSKGSQAEDAVDLIDMCLLTINGIEMMSMPREQMIPPLLSIKGALEKGFLCGVALKDRGPFVIRSPFERDYSAELRHAVASARSAFKELKEASAL